MHGLNESREDYFLSHHDRLGAKFAKEPSGPLDLCEDVADPTASRLATVSPPPIYERYGDERYSSPLATDRGAAHAARGRAAASKTATAPARPVHGVPRYLEVASPNGCCHCEGHYVLEDSARPRLVWRKSSGDRWLYLGSSGRWYIDGDAAEEAGFACSAGFLRSEQVDFVDGAGHPTPLDVPLFGWERGLDFRWYPDAEVVISEASKYPDAEVVISEASELPHQAEMQEELHCELMDSCSAVQNFVEDPAHSAHLAYSSIADVRAELEKDDWIVNRFLREEIKATDIISLPIDRREPTRGSEPGMLTASRRSYFTMPVPKDNVPTIVSLLSGLPETTRVTAAFSLQATEVELTLVQWTAMHDVVFGENFRVQDTLSFRPHPECGVEFRRWTEVVWVTELPVLHEAFRGTLEERILMEAMRSAAAFSRILDDESRRRRGVAGERVADKAPAPQQRGQNGHFVAPAPHAEQAKLAFSMAIRKMQERGSTREDTWREATA